MGKIADKNLTDKQSKFVHEYLTNGFNATRAVIAAGYSSKGAHTQGSQLLRNIKVAQAVKKGLDEIITPERIKAELAEMALECDPADFEELLKGASSLSELRRNGVDTRLIKKIKATRRVLGTGENKQPYEDVTIELHDRQAALEKLARIHAMFTDRSEVEANVTGRIAGVPEDLVGDFLAHVASRKGGPSEDG